MKKTLFLLSFLVLLSGSISAKEKPKKSNVEELAKTTLSWDGNKLPSYATGTPEITILKITIEPHQKLALHTHPVINAGVLLTGELTVITENEDVLNLKAGEALVEVVNTWHYGINKGDEPAEILVFYAGVEGEPITIKK